MSNPPEDPRLPKKQHRWDENPLDDLVSGRPINAVEISTASDGSVLFDDDDFDLLDEDVNCGIKDGVPFIDFSMRVQELANKSMEYALVLKLLGRHVGFSILYNRLLSLWNPEKPIRLTDIENDYYIVKFSSQSDYLAALTDGPGPFSATTLRLNRGLPIIWYKRSLLEAIGSCVGSMVKIDFQTDNGRRGRFARMAVKINLNQPLVSKIVINGRTQLVVYESLPVVCFHCGTYGHTHDQFPRHTQVPNPPATTVSSPAPSPIQLPTESYVPWIFNPLFSGNDHAHTSDIPVAADSVEAPAKHSDPTGGVTAPVIEPAIEPVLETPTTTPTFVPKLVVVPSGNKSKAKGKVTGVVRKHNPNVLGSRNLNIMSLKNSVGVNSSCSKISKGRHSHPVLNPEKHTALTLDLAAPPISVTRNF
ncbi:hypothetical protein V6N11_056007 [Hibiscus sabdariffa]|uniref:DUF4283 domain-containing protein n=1 Tax=Hibiscus sabdariffa TaxID=183260 RepID=A0ABR2T3E5_9ROSI